MRQRAPATPSVLLLPVLLLTFALAGDACVCTPPPLQRQVAGLTVTLDPVGGRILVEHTDDEGGRPLLQLRADDIRTFDHEVRYDMQFGMFDIQELGAPTNVRTGATLEVLDDDALSFLVKDAAGIVAQGSFLADAGGLVVGLKASADVVEVTSACGFSHAIGFGAQSADVDHVGQTVPLWVSEQGIGKSDTDELPLLWQVLGRRHTTHVPIPAFVTDARAAFVVDSSAYVEVDVCTQDRLRMEVWDGVWALRVFAGSTVQQAQAKMVDALGRPPLLPPWAFAPWIDAIFGSDAVRERALALRAAQIPASALWTEDWRGGVATSAEQYRLDEDWRLDRALYPDFEELLFEMQTLGFVSQLYFNTFLTEGGDVFDEALAARAAIELASGEPALFSGPDREFSPTALVDLSGPRGRGFVKQHLLDALALGARGWMADYAEWMPVDDVVIESGEDPALVHNRYPVLWAEVNREALEEAGRLDDSIVYARAGHLGSQSQVQVMWAGDQRTTFDVDDGLPTVLPIGIGLAAVGFPFVTHDIGGYQSNTNPPATKELFFRWTSLGAFTPVMRTHHGTHALVNWQLFSDEETTAHFKRMADVHVRLYPYLRALARDAVAPGGLPLWIPLPLLFPDDDVWALKDEVMLGPSLLVAPVVDAGVDTRLVTFPRGRFAPFFDGGSAVVGPDVVGVSAAVNEIPVFVRAGGIVPMLAEPVDTLLPDVPGLRDLGDTEGDREVMIGAGKDGAFVEESGARYTLTQGASAVPGRYEHTGNGSVSVGGDAVLTLEGHPDGRVTFVVVR